jgi:xylulokinase
VGTGEFATVPEACGATIREADRLLPRPAESAVYASGYEIYRDLYPALQPLICRS